MGRLWRRLHERGPGDRNVQRSNPAAHSTIAPACKASATSRRAITMDTRPNSIAGLPEVRRSRTTEGAATPVSASSVPKSASAEIRMRFSSTARWSTNWSGADCRPYSRTCTESWPALFSLLEMTGDKALSTRNFKALRDRKLALTNRIGGIAEGFADVFFFEVGISGQDLLMGHPISNHGDDAGYRNTEAADAA